MPTSANSLDFISKARKEDPVVGIFFFWCAGHGIYLDGESPSWGLSSQWSTTSRTPRVSSVRKNLKEGEDKTVA